jgi:hypothetical protein
MTDRVFADHSTVLLSTYPLSQNAGRVMAAKCLNCECLILGVQSMRERKSESDGGGSINSFQINEKFGRGGAI